MSGERWMVVGKNRMPIITGMYRRENAQQEADELNRSGLQEYAPYRVVRDEVAEDLES
jgi:hypothetical protein